MKKLFALLPLIAVLALNTGCVRGTLAPAGVYHGDQFAYSSDFYISSSYTTISTFLKWELQNRSQIPHEVTIGADRIRDEAPRAFASAVALRNAYNLNPSAANKTALQQALDVLRQAVVEATQYMTPTVTLTQ